MFQAGHHIRISPAWYHREFDLRKADHELNATVVEVMTGYLLATIQGPFGSSEVCPPQHECIHGWAEKPHDMPLLEKVKQSFKNDPCVQLRDGWLAEIFGYPRQKPPVTRPARAYVPRIRSHFRMVEVREGSSWIQLDPADLVTKDIYRVAREGTTGHWEGPFEGVALPQCFCPGRIHEGRPFCDNNGSNFIISTKMYQGLL